MVWNQLSKGEGATGGSPSKYEPQPSWQNSVSKNAGNTHRGLGDIAFDGDPESGAIVIVDGSNEQIGGTSLSSPLFVGVWARALATKSSLGFAAPLIYSDAASNYSADFHDVTSGNNSGETAATGWDYPTGFGSVNIASFVSHVAGGGGGGNQPPVANFSFTTNGLTANFTNSSTNSDGTVTAHSWTFGDGGTSTATNPTHTQYSWRHAAITAPGTPRQDLARRTGSAASQSEPSRTTSSCTSSAPQARVAGRTNSGSANGLGDRASVLSSRQADTSRVLSSEIGSTSCRMDR